MKGIHHFEIETDNRGIGKIIMDGVDITAGCTGVKFKNMSLGLPSITLEFTGVAIKCSTEGKLRLVEEADDPVEEILGRKYAGQ